MSLTMVFSTLLALAVSDENCSKKVTKNLCLKTPLRGGKIYDFLLFDLLPAYRLIASGRVKNDECFWRFEDAPLFTEADTAFAAKRTFKEDMDDISNPDKLILILNTHWVGLFSILKMSYECETRQMPDGRYRCGLTRLGVEKWCSPYGYICSRDEAVNYYKECYQIVNKVVKMVMAAKKPNGEPLTRRQKLKYVHDWLITSVAYDYKGLKKRRREPMSYAMTYLAYLSNEYGAIIDGEAICEGYSAAFKVIVDELIRRKALKGVECDIAVNDSHAWNRVWLDGHWYNVDVTWDDFGVEDFFYGISSEYFLVSDKNHKIKRYDTFEYLNEPATDRRYEKMRWPSFRKNLAECTVELKYPEKTYVYKKGRKVVPKVIVKYGKNEFPEQAFRVVRADHNQIGAARARIIPSRKCTALKGSVMGPSFMVNKARF